MTENDLYKLSVKMFGWSFEWLLIWERNAVLKEYAALAAGKCDR